MLHEIFQFHNSFYLSGVLRFISHIYLVYSKFTAEHLPYWVVTFYLIEVHDDVFLSLYYSLK